MIARHHVLRFSRLGAAFASKVGERLLGYYSKSSGFLRRPKFFDEISSLIWKFSRLGATFAPKVGKRLLDYYTIKVQVF